MVSILTLRRTYILITPKTILIPTQNPVVRLGKWDALMLHHHQALLQLKRVQSIQGSLPEAAVFAIRRINKVIDLIESLTEIERDNICQFTCDNNSCKVFYEFILSYVSHDPFRGSHAEDNTK